MTFPNGDRDEDHEDDNGLGWLVAFETFEQSDKET